MSTRNATRIIAAFILALIIFAMMIGLGGCKAVEKYKKSPDFPADCASEFPVKTDSFYIKGDEIRDTLISYEYGTDTVTRIIDAVQTQYVDRIITKTITQKRVDTLVKEIENTAKIEALRRTARVEIASLAEQVAELDENAAKDKKKIKGLRKQRNIGFGLTSLFVAFIFRHKIIGFLSGGFGWLAGFIRKRR